MADLSGLIYKEAKLINTGYLPLGLGGMNLF